MQWHYAFARACPCPCANTHECYMLLVPRIAFANTLREYVMGYVTIVLCWLLPRRSEWVQRNSIVISLTTTFYTLAANAPTCLLLFFIFARDILLLRPLSSPCIYLLSALSSSVSFDPSPTPTFLDWLLILTSPPARIITENKSILTDSDWKKLWPGANPPNPKNDNSLDSTSDSPTFEDTEVSDFYRTIANLQLWHFFSPFVRIVRWVPRLCPIACALKAQFLYYIYLYHIYVYNTYILSTI